MAPSWEPPRSRHVRIVLVGVWVVSGRTSQPGPDVRGCARSEGDR
jgi:hypothetical protein